MQSDLFTDATGHGTPPLKALVAYCNYAVLYRQIGTAHRQGAIIGLYLMLYSAARFMVEFFRYHEQGNLWGTPLDTSQWISLGLFALGIWCFFRREPQAAAPEKLGRRVEARH